MTPERAARNLLNVGLALIALVLLLRMLSLTDAYAQSRRKTPKSAYAAVPFLGNYTFSPSGAQVGFEQGWVPATTSNVKGRKDDFYLDLRTGQFTPGSLPSEDITPFVLRDNRLWLTASDGFTLTSGSPQDMRVDANTLARSPDGSMMAFVARNTSASLFVLSTSGQLSELIQADVLNDPSWSPDGDALAFTMRRESDPQPGAHIYRSKLDGSELLQLTRGSIVAYKSRWSPDGKSIAYLEIPANPTQSGRYDIGLIDSSGDHQRVLTSEGGEKISMTWIAGMRKIAYTMRSAEWQFVEDLFVIDADAENAQPVRLYPPVTVEALECPKTLPRDGVGTVQVTLLNSGPQSVAIPLVLRAGKQLIPLFNVIPSPSPFGTPAPNQQFSAQATPSTTIPEQRRQIVALDAYIPGLTSPTVGAAPTAQVIPTALTTPTPGGTPSVVSETNAPVGIERAIALPARPVSGLVTYFSAVVIPEGQFLVSEKHCAVRTTYLGLPNLPYLPSVLPLTAAGMLLAVPWLRHRRKLYWWATWLAIPVFIAVLILIETRFLPPLNLPQ